MKKSTFLRAVLIGVVVLMRGAGPVQAASALPSGPMAQVIAAPPDNDQPPEPIPASPAADGDLASRPALRFVLENGVFVLASLAVIVVFFALGTNRLGSAPTRPAAFSPGVGLVMAIGLLVVAPQVGSAIGRSILGLSLTTSLPAELDMRSTAILTMCVYSAQAAIVAVYITLQWRAKPPEPDLRAGRGRCIMVGFTALVLAWPLVSVVSGVFAWLLNQPEIEIAHKTLAKIIEAPWDGWKIAMSALVVLAAPVMEEVAYRGILQQMLVQSGIGRWAAIIAASAGFALMHAGIVPVHGLAGLFVLSLAMGWAYERTGRLMTPIIIHALFNAANLGLATL